MKKYLLFILVYFTILPAFGQDFAPLHAKWHFQKWCIGCDNCGYFSIEVDRDTVINGKKAMIVENRDNGELRERCTVIIREDSGRVSFFEDGQFNLLYNFNLTTGDTMSFKIPSNSECFDFTCGFDWDSIQGGQLIVDSTKTITIDSVPLKSLYTTSISADSVSWGWEFGQIIEKIGSMEGLFGHSIGGCLGGCPGHFRCYQDSLINYKAATEECEAGFAPGIENTPNRNRFSIYPNPTSNKLTIQSDEGSVNHITLYSRNGARLLRKTTRSTRSVEMSLTGMERGVYLISIQFQDGGIATKRIVKL